MICGCQATVRTCNDYSGSSTILYRYWLLLWELLNQYGYVRVRFWWSNGKKRRKRICIYIYIYIYIKRERETADSSHKCTSISKIKTPVFYITLRPVTWSFDVFFELRLNKRLSKQSRRQWFETLSHSLGRHCNVFKITSLALGHSYDCPNADKSQLTIWVKG